MWIIRSALIAAVFIVGGKSIHANSIGDSISNTPVLIHKIHILGNKSTKIWIIQRELSISEGDSLTGFELVNQLKISKQNLINTFLFNFVDTRYVIDELNRAEVYIMLSERWYFWPIPILDLAETHLNSWWVNKDFSRISYGVDFRKKNFRGRNDELNLFAQLGYTQLLAIEYTVPYINKKQTLGFKARLSYGQNHEVNYISDDNLRLFYKDVNKIQQRTSGSEMTFIYRRQFYSRHLFGIGFGHVEIGDSILELNPDYLTSGKKKMNYFNLSYRYLLDSRDNQNYALRGRYFSGTLIKYGLGLLSPSVDLWWVKLEYKHYWQLFPRVYPAFLTQIHFYPNRRQPYFLRDGLGYEDKSTIRSYELYVIDAQQFAIAKFQLRYQLVAPKSYNFNFIPLNKFKKVHFSLYAGIFGDIGYAYDRYGYPNNEMANSLQYGSGISLDIASYYNVVFRTEYSLNKFGEHGIFLHFVAPI